ncbi:MAG: tRNA pseudouridine(13) synthase TruD [Aestuariibacter sp.]
MNGLALTTEHWAYLHGRPASTGELKQQPDDFIVEEQLSFAPSGEGEHLFLYIEKQNLNTGFVAQALAKHFKCKDRDVAYAGRKDKFALTRQWFSIYLPGIISEQLATFELPQCRVLRETRHHKKLRLGTIAANHFNLTLRECQLQSDFEQRLQSVMATGVPNYFGSQRFGNLHPDGRHGNLALAEELINGNPIRKRDKRSMAISALRSWLFNEFVSHRVSQQCFHQAMAGDTFILSGSNSFFSEVEIDDTLVSRLQKRDILLSAPMWGTGALSSTADALQFEQNIAAQHQILCDTLCSLGLKQERRPIQLIPEGLHFDINKNTVKLQFSLPSGCFATSVIRELFTNIN